MKNLICCISGHKFHKNVFVQTGSREDRMTGLAGDFHFTTPTGYYVPMTYDKCIRCNTEKPEETIVEKE